LVGIGSKKDNEDISTSATEYFLERDISWKVAQHKIGMRNSIVLRIKNLRHLRSRILDISILGELSGVVLSKNEFPYMFATDWVQPERKTNVILKKAVYMNELHRRYKINFLL
jgi:hypothetical protein